MSQEFNAFNISCFGKTVSWEPREPYLSGDTNLVTQLLAVLDTEIEFAVTPTGPFISSNVEDGAAVYLASIEAFGEHAEFQNAPDLTSLWLEPSMLDEDGEVRKDLIF